MPTIKYYYISISVTYFLVILSISIYLLFFQDIIQIPECGFYVLTGYYCPGCGFTRAVIALKNLNILESLKYNPFILYTFTFSTLFIFIESINSFFKKNITLPWKFIVYFGLVVLFFNWIVQNIIIFIKK